MVTAALTGELDEVDYQPHPIFKVLVPHIVPGIPTEVLNPKCTWSDPDAYDQQANALAKSFAANFQQFATASPELIAAAPVVSS
jgi:phosphoenolpyruvate carboxykinase (ATP)